GAEPLRGGDDIRRQRRRVRREPGTGATHAGDDLVEADEEAVLAAPLLQSLPEAPWRRVGRQRRRTDRLAEEGGDVLRPGLLEGAVERLERSFARRVEPARARRDVEVPGEIRPERAVQARPPRQRERLHRRAVVGLRLRDDLP